MCLMVLNNGGGGLSPILFVSYPDRLLVSLKNSVYGCYIGDVLWVVSAMQMM